MLQWASIFLCIGAAWSAAGIFSHSGTKAALADGALAGSICGITAFLLPLAGLPIALTALLFPLLSVFLPVQQKQSWEERFLSFCVAAGCCSLLLLLDTHIRHLLPGAAPALTLLAAFVLVAVFWRLREQMPPRGWQECFDGQSHERMTVSRSHIWLALGAMAAAEAALLLLFRSPLSLGQAAVLVAAAALLYIGDIYAVCLMVAYRRERLTTLIDQNYRNEMQSFMSVIRSQRHDYNFHVQALSGLINDGNIEECRQYLDNLVRDSTDMNTILPIRDPAIAALVFSFRTMALEYGIELHMDIQNDLSGVVTSVYETNKVIGNLLQNAIDEVRTHTDKSFGIHLYILKRGENAIIHVANQLSPKADAQSYIQDVYKPGVSSKAGHEGIGLSSIQNLLSRYRGVVYSRLDGDIIHFVAKIPLEMQGELE